MIPGIKIRRCKRHTPVYHDCYTIHEHTSPTHPYSLACIHTHTKMHTGNSLRPATKLNLNIGNWNICIQQFLLGMELRDFMIEQCFIFNSRISNRPQRRSCCWCVSLNLHNDAIEIWAISKLWVNYTNNDNNSHSHSHTQQQK